jgi:hypothetical protein
MGVMENGLSTFETGDGTATMLPAKAWDAAKRMKQNSSNEI